MQAPSKNSDTPYRLREVIAKTGLSQAKFAELISEDLFRLKNVLSGTMRMPTDMLGKVVERCGVDATWLLTGWRLEIGELSDTEKIMLGNFRLLNVTEQGVMVRAIVGLAGGEQLRQKVVAAKSERKAT